MYVYFNNNVVLGPASINLYAIFLKSLTKCAYSWVVFYGSYICALCCDSIDSISIVFDI